MIHRDEKIPSVVLLCCSVPTKSRKAAISCQRGGGEVGPRLDRVRPHLNGLGNLVPGTRLDLGRSTQKEQVGGETDPPKISCTFGDLTNAKYHISSYIFSSHFFQSLNSSLYYWKQRHIFHLSHGESGGVVSLKAVGLLHSVSTRPSIATWEGKTILGNL